MIHGDARNRTTTPDGSSKGASAYSWRRTWPLAEFTAGHGTSSTTICRKVAENFIHRVGRTGRNGDTAWLPPLREEQRSELFQLERRWVQDGAPAPG